MKSIFLSFLAVTALTASAQSKIDIRSRAIIQRARIAAQTDDPQQVITLGHGLLSAPVQINDNSIRLLINVTDPSDLSALEEAGASVDEIIGSCVIADIDIDNISSLESIPGIKSITTPRKRQLRNDLGRGNNGMRVDQVHNGTELNRSYKGDNVIVGLFDMGIDPNHIAFKDESGDNLRVKRVWCYTGNQYTGAVTAKTYDTATKIKGFTTDDSDETHGTHVLGTITGAYTGNKYYGMAPNADIAIGCGDAYDDAILKSIQNIVNYAKSEGKPAVINLSLGSNFGHHDGTDAFSVALNAMAEKTPVIVAAGNEGDTYIVARKELSSDDTTLKTVLVPSYYITQQNSRFQAYGDIEIIASDSRSFDVSIAVIDATSGTIKTELALSTSEKYFGGSSSGVSPITSNSTFTSAYSTRSYIGGAKGTCPDNGRYYAQIACDLMTKASSSNTYTALIVKGKAGQTIEVFTDGYTELSNLNLDGYTDGTNDGTISDMACGEHTIAVGAYATRNSSPYSGATLLDILDYSSYGKLIDGRTLPHICAPGQAIISSMSNYYRNSDYFDASYDKIYAQVSAQTGRTEYWCHMGGTSMATPGVTGSVALMLEADPTLTPAEIRDIITATARKDGYVIGGKAYQPYQWGAGKMDTHAALVEVLNRSNHTGVDGIADNSSEELLVESEGNGIYRVALPGADKLSIDIYTISGLKTSHVESISGEAVIDLSSASRGLYIATVAANGATHTLKLQH